MQFTLIYRGDLPPKASADDKWRIRREIDPQLRKLWSLEPLNDIEDVTRPNDAPALIYVGKTVGDIEYIPIVSKALKLQTKLSIRLLSATKPGGLVQHGDIDNRLKTLLDALSIPSKQQIPDNADLDADGRMFCLLEDDDLVTSIDVSNDRLLTEEDHSKQAIVIVDVQPVALSVTLKNLAIAF
ncbi:hypothetical protein [Denitrobaculum tricleocarpae]|uniref:Uncharacterized protein n=1 Tax=Denitrobaculum tricleocarpae TaxID=2591009 RepID=A0A545STQ9_9PROT|nr:hypothetical protein [Denitrobaculum tricleocarpae]TQV68338.1 hypothetical protein FKG95_28975 [Denitrobaculum tricleocarpae]